MRYPHFIYESLKHPIEIGTLVQSSRFLANKMAREIEGKKIVEFGAGTGSITSKLLAHLPEDGKLTCFEINKRFCNNDLEEIRRKDSRLRIINDDVENLEKYVNSAELDCIVSSLPLALMGKEKREKLLELSSKAKKYIQMQYTPFLLKKLKNYFSNVKVKFTPFNFPFAFIYVCSNRKYKKPKI